MYLISPYIEKLPKESFKHLIQSLVAEGERQVQLKDGHEEFGRFLSYGGLHLSGSLAFFFMSTTLCLERIGLITEL